MFHNGYVVVTSPCASALGVYLTPFPTDNENQVDICIHSYMWHEYPLVQVSQTDGSFTKDTSTIVSSLPLNGFVKMDMYGNTLIQIYRNPYNTYWGTMI